MRFDHAAQQVPDIAEAVAWYQRTIPGCDVLHQDSTWALVEAAGVRLAFVIADQHPNHLGWRVGSDDLERLAAEHGAEIHPHRDGTRSFYVEGPGEIAVEIISYPGE